MKKITQLINETHPRLSNLMISNSAIEIINDSLKKIELFAQHPKDYRITKFSQGILYLSVSTAAFATRLRHLTSMILQDLRKETPNIEFNALQCKVTTFTAPTLQKNHYKKLQAKKMTEKTRAGIAKLSDTIASKELSDALKKLVR